MNEVNGLEALAQEISALHDIGEAFIEANVRLEKCMETLSDAIGALVDMLEDRELCDDLERLSSAMKQLTDVLSEDHWKAELQNREG